MHSRFLRILILAIVSLGLFPSRALAFSMGEIRVMSAYNLPFRAEIPALTDGRRDLDVSLGDDLDYERVGVARPAFLKEFKVTVADHPTMAGQMLITITSAAPVSLPSFNLVVKARLGGGVILENYFLALDLKRNVGLELPAPSEDEKQAMTKIAEELSALKPGAPPRKEEPAAPPVDELDRIRREEQEAVASEQAAPASAAPAPPVEEKIVAQDIVPPPPPVVVETPAPAVEEKKTETPPPAPKIERAAPVAVAAPVTEEGLYLVRGGDTLYRVAGGFASGAERDRVVVALWRDNPGAFIKGNLHGLKAGARLDTSRLDETVKTISPEEARRIIAGQWPAWRDKAAPAASAVAAEKKPSAPAAAPAGETRVALGKPLVDVKAPVDKLPFKNAIMAALAEWKASHDKGDLAKYLESYAAAYRTGNEDRKALETRARKEGVGQQPLPVDMAGAVITQRDGYVEVVLPAPPGAKTGARTLYLVQEKGQWRIAREEAAPVRAAVKQAEAPAPSQPAAGRPFVVHVASFKTAEPAARLVELLRLKGYNAFEVYSHVAGSGEWRRVVIDRFPTAQEADAFAQEVKVTGLARYARILRLPYAIRLGPPTDETQAKAAERAFAAMGIPAYVAVDEKSGAAITLVGAYETESQARTAMGKLPGVGAQAEVVAP